jgi:hypothetical protein
MLHPIVLKAHRRETAASMPEWMGVGVFFCGLVASGILVVSTLSDRAWVVGFVAGIIFVTALFTMIGYLFPEHRRQTRKARASAHPDQIHIRTLDELVAHARAHTRRLLRGKKDASVDAFLVKRRRETERE